MIDWSNPSTWPRWVQDATRLAGPLSELDPRNDLDEDTTGEKS